MRQLFMIYGGEIGGQFQFGGIAITWQISNFIYVDNSYGSSSQGYWNFREWCFIDCVYMGTILKIFSYFPVED